MISLNDIHHTFTKFSRKVTSAVHAYKEPSPFSVINYYCFSHQHWFINQCVAVTKALCIIGFKAMHLHQPPRLSYTM